MPSLQNQNAIQITSPNNRKYCKTNPIIFVVPYKRISIKNSYSVLAGGEKGTNDSILGILPIMLVPLTFLFHTQHRSEVISDIIDWRYNQVLSLRLMKENLISNMKLKISDCKNIEGIFAPILTFLIRYKESNEMVKISPITFSTILSQFLSQEYEKHDLVCLSANSD